MKTKIILLIVLSFLMAEGFGQECRTISTSPNQDFSNPMVRGVYKPNLGPYCINATFHIVRQSNGTGGFNPTDVSQVLANMNEHFNPVNIFISIADINFIDSDTYYNVEYYDVNNSAPEFSQLIQNYSDSDVIDFYLVNSIPIINAQGGQEGQWGGLAEDILSKNIVMGNSSALSTTASHELGHCLNLFHTHHGTHPESGDPNQCAELPNGSNGSICGDYIQDTPADPKLLPNNNNGTMNLDLSTCTYFGGGGYNPDVTNIMSYGASCRTNLSPLQGQRMRDALLYSPLLQAVVSNSCPGGVAVGDNVVCADGGTEITVLNANPPYTWSVSSNLSITQNNGATVTVVANNNQTQAPGWIDVVYSGGTYHKIVWVGKPNPPAFLNGPEIVNTGGLVAYQGGIALGASSYVWWLPHPFEVVTEIDYAGQNWQMWENTSRSISHVFTGYGENNGLVQLMGENKCGIGSVEYLTVIHGNGGPGGGQTAMPVVPFPNVADDSFSLDFSKQQEGKYAITLYDMYATVLYSCESNNELITIDTQDIPDGIYFLHYFDGTEHVRKQLVIKH